MMFYLSVLIHSTGTLLLYLVLIISVIIFNRPIPVAARSKGQFCGRSLAIFASSNLAGGFDICVL